MAVQRLVTTLLMEPSDCTWERLFLFLRDSTMNRTAYHSRRIKNMSPSPQRKMWSLKLGVESLKTRTRCLFSSRRVVTCDREYMTGKLWQINTDIGLSYRYWICMNLFFRIYSLTSFFMYFDHVYMCFCILVVTYGCVIYLILP